MPINGNRAAFFVFFQVARRFRCAAALRVRASALITRFFAALPINWPRVPGYDRYAHARKTPQAISRKLFWIRRPKKGRIFLLFSKRKHVIIPVGNLKVDTP
jgi:hypothetical protein